MPARRARRRARRRSMANASESPMPMQGFVTEFCWGRVWTRRDLRPSDPELAQPRHAHRPQPHARVRCPRPRHGEQRLHRRRDPRGARAGRRCTRAAALERSGRASGRRRRSGPCLTSAASRRARRQDRLDDGRCAWPGPAGRCGRRPRQVSLELPAARHVVRWRDVAGVADVVGPMLPTRSCHAVLLAGGVRRIAPDSVVVDMGSSEPDAHPRDSPPSRAERGVASRRRPVSGGVPRAAVAGTLTIMVGGPYVGLERVQPDARAARSRIVHVGDRGAGHAVKALNNLMSATHLLVTSEAVEHPGGVRRRGPEGRLATARRR